MASRKPSSASKGSPARLAYVETVRAANGTIYLYYRRGGRRIALPGPEGSEAFQLAYEHAERLFEGPPDRGGSGRHTVDDVIAAYLDSADYRQLAPKTRADYRRVLDGFRGHFGDLPAAALTEPWIEQLRAKYAPDPRRGEPGHAIEWNALRARMISAMRHYRRVHPEAGLANPWEGSRRLKPPTSTAHRPWPPEVLRAVLRAATPEFRVLLVGYLLTAQRGGDVTRFAPSQYDAESRTLTLSQGKTEVALRIHVPGPLAAAIEAMRGRSATRLFVTPRGKAWTTGNAQETLARLLEQLGLPRHTLHGLRATGPVALKMLGFENRAIRSLTGHTSDRNLEVYLRGVEHYPLAREAQEALAGVFGPVLEDALAGSNQRRFSGVTGRAARASAKSVPNAKSRRREGVLSD
jgi:hypothetical protein